MEIHKISNLFNFGLIYDDLNVLPNCMVEDEKGSS